VDGVARADQVIERMRSEIDTGLIPAAVFNDPEIHALEQERIFSRCWVFIGHESEVPQPGDYCVRRIGKDPFIFVRDEDGVIRVLFNGCRHRGSIICRADAGNTSHFRCPYHAWTYKTNGELVGVPSLRTGYGQLDMSQWGLFAAAGVESYNGLVFATLDPEAPSFSEYLGGFKWYLDINFNLTDRGMEVVGEPHRWLVDADWKSGAENFCGDSSHTQMTHRSLLQVGLADNAGAGSPGQGAQGLHINSDGHAVSIRRLGPESDNFWGYPAEVRSLFRPGPLSDAQFDLAKRAVVHDGTVFPNFSYIHFSAKEDLTKPGAGFLAIRVWQPREAGKMEIWNWVLAPREASDEYKARAYRAGMTSFSPAGHFEQDDVTVWSGVARSAGSTFGKLREVSLNYQMGMPGMGATQPLSESEWAGPGTAWPSNGGEAGLRAFHGHWVARMSVR
jgi:phenylpropionate dioxygenase-like ring-hydroxylating dioxygenase large terminal subunit